MKMMLGAGAATLIMAFCAVQTACAAEHNRTDFNKGWKFARFGLQAKGGRKDEPQGIEKPDFDDADWRQLDLPHDWGIEGPFRPDIEGASGKLPWKGIGWYRKTFTISEKDKGKQIFLDFDGAMANAVVYLNGRKVGEWPYGYSSFRVELTDLLNWGATNMVAVRLNTEKWDSRWYPGAGIYRNVWLVKTSPVHVAHWGSYITTPQIGKKTATVQNAVTIDNQSNKETEAAVKTEIRKLKANGKPGGKIAEADAAMLTIPAGKSAKAINSVELKNAELWDLDSPNLYSARTVVSVGGKIVDVYDSTFGIRTINFAADGFYLNGKRIQINGVCNHHDLGPLGTAYNRSARERQFRILKEMGCNAFRTSHNPPAPETLEICDRLGFLVMDEALDCWFKGKKSNDYNLIFEDWAIKDVTAMVMRDRNHPSIILWSNGNEVPGRATPKGMEWSRRFTALFHELDPTRQVVNCCNCIFRYIKTDFPGTVDVFGFNYAPRFYGMFHKLPGRENQPFIGSETSCCASSRGEYFFPVVSKGHEHVCHTDARADFQTSSYDVQAPGWGCSPDEEFAYLDKVPDCAGEFVWTGFDYLGEPTPYSKDTSIMLNFSDPKKRAEMKKQMDELKKIEVPSRSSYFGINDLCGFPKDRYYIYQARWRPEHRMVHILPHWNWPERVGKVTPVHVYTSGDEVELFLNGKSLGRKKKGLYQYRLRWDDVVYQPGTLKAVAYKSGKPWATETVKSTGKAEHIVMKSDRKTVKFDSSELAFITVSVNDDEGAVVPRTHNRINFSIDGPGKIVAVGNGDATDHDLFQSHSRRVFNGLCLVMVKPTGPGIITLRARSDGLQGASCSIRGVN